MCSNLSRLTLLLAYTLRSAGAQALSLSPFYRHIAPLERRFLSDHQDFGISGLLKECESGSSCVCLSIFSAKSTDFLIQTIMMHTPLLYHFRLIEFALL